MKAAVRSHRALGCAGGSRGIGIEQVLYLGRQGGRLLGATLIDQVRKCRIAFLGAGACHQRNVAHALRCLESDLPPRRIEEIEFRPAARENDGDLARGEARIDQHHDAARFGDAIKGLDELDAVLKMHGHPVAVREPMHAQGVGEPVAAPIEFAIAQASRIAHGREAAGIAQSLGFEHGSELHRIPLVQLIRSVDACKLGA